MLVLCDPKFQAKASRLRALFKKAFGIYNQHDRYEEMSTEEIDGIYKVLSEHLNTFPKELAHQVQSHHALLKQSVYSLKQLITFNKDKNIEQSLKAEMILKGRRSPFFYDLLSAAFLFSTLDKNIYFKQLLQIEILVQDHLLPETFIVYASGCLEYIMELIEQFYFSWFVIFLGVHEQIRQLRKDVLRIYFELKNKFARESYNVWQLISEKKPVPSMSFVETVILDPLKAQGHILEKYWAGQENIDCDWWASEILSTQDKLLEPSFRVFIENQGDGLHRSLVKIMLLEIKQAIEQEGMSNFYSSRWSLWINGLFKKYQIWSFILDAKWQNTLIQLNRLALNAEQAYAWASMRQTDGLAGEYRQAMVQLGFKLSGGD